MDGAEGWMEVLDGWSSRMDGAGLDGAEGWMEVRSEEWLSRQKQKRRLRKGSRAAHVVREHFQP